MISPKSADQKYSVNYQDETASPGGGTVNFRQWNGNFMWWNGKLRWWNARQVAERRSTPFRLNLTTGTGTFVHILVDRIVHAICCALGRFQLSSVV